MSPSLLYVGTVPPDTDAVSFCALAVRVVVVPLVVTPAKLPVASRLYDWVRDGLAIVSSWLPLWPDDDSVPARTPSRGPAVVGRVRVAARRAVGPV